MEKFEQKRESGLSKVVGATPEEEKEILEEIKEDFKSPDIWPAEIEKSPEDLELIRGILEKMPEFIKSYGGAPLYIKPENIHILDPEELTEEEKKFLGGDKFKNHGCYSVPKQTIAIPPIENKLDRARVITHELIHFHSFQSATLTPEKKLTRRKEGIAIFSRHGELLFNQLNEAIVEELTKMFDKENFESINNLASEIEDRERLRKWVIEFHREDRDVAEDIFRGEHTISESGEHITTTKTYDYKKERGLLRKIINDIYEKNKEKFGSSEDVFKCFVEAVFTGRLLEVAKLIEGTYGKGSFRRIAEETKKEAKEE